MVGKIHRLMKGKRTGKGEAGKQLQELGKALVRERSWPAALRALGGCGREDKRWKWAAMEDTSSS